MSIDRKTNSQENGDNSVWTPTNGVSIVWANMALPHLVTGVTSLDLE